MLIIAGKVALDHLEHVVARVALMQDRRNLLQLVAFEVREQVDHGEIVSANALHRVIDAVSEVLVRVEAQAAQQVLRIRRHARLVHRVSNVMFKLTSVGRIKGHVVPRSMAAQHLKEGDCVVPKLPPIAGGKEQRDVAGHLSWINHRTLVSSAREQNIEAHLEIAEVRRVMIDQVHKVLASRLLHNRFQRWPLTIRRERADVNETTVVDGGDALEMHGLVQGTGLDFNWRAEPAGQNLSEIAHCLMLDAMLQGVAKQGCIDSINDLELIHGPIANDVDQSATVGVERVAFQREA